MNRKKKLNSILNKRMKKIKAKLAPDGKEKYISKAERAKLNTLDEQELNENEPAITE